MARTGADVTPTSPRHRKLLAALLLNPNRVLTVSRLVDVVWTRNPPQTARKQVQNCLSWIRFQLREADAGAALASRAGGYVIIASEATLDSEAFRHHLDRARSCLGGHNEDAAAGHLDTALRLWRGPVLEDVDSPALWPDKVQLQDLRTDAVLLRAGLCETTGWVPVEVVTILRREAAALPYHEGVAASLARVLALTGRSAEALQVISRYKRGLAQDLGLDPSPRVIGLELELLQAPGSTLESVHHREQRELRTMLADIGRRLTMASDLAARLGAGD